MDGGGHSQNVDHSGGHVQKKLADLRTCQQQKGKNKGPGKKNLGIFALKAQAGQHTFYGLK